MDGDYTFKNCPACKKLTMHQDYTRNGFTLSYCCNCAVNQILLTYREAVANPPPLPGSLKGGG